MATTTNYVSNENNYNLATYSNSNIGTSNRYSYGNDCSTIDFRKATVTHDTRVHTAQQLQLEQLERLCSEIPRLPHDYPYIRSQVKVKVTNLKKLTKIEILQEALHATPSQVAW